MTTPATPIPAGADETNHARRFNIICRKCGSYDHEFNDFRHVVGQYQGGIELCCRACDNAEEIHDHAAPVSKSVERRVAVLKRAEADADLLAAAKAADEAMATWCSAEWNSHPIHLRLRAAIAAASRSPSREGE
jgi:hypothetical protein